MASDRARLVLAWIGALEDRVDLTEHFEDIIAEHRFAPGKIMLLAPPDLLPVDPNVFGEPSGGADGPATRYHLVSAWIP